VDTAVPDLERTHGLGVGANTVLPFKGMAAVVPEGGWPPRRDPRVAYVEADQEVFLFQQTLPTGIDRLNADLNSTAKIDGLDERVNVGVAVIDTGIDFDHPDLNVVARTDCSMNILPPLTSCANNSGDDGHGHGTHVAGTIGALDNGFGVVGVAPGVNLYAVKVLLDNGTGYMSAMISGVGLVTAHASQIKVANMSLGCECPSSAMDTAIHNSVAACDLRRRGWQQRQGCLDVYPGQPPGCDHCIGAGRFRRTTGRLQDLLPVRGRRRYTGELQQLR
jgi:subtilisin family serine protease